MFKWPYSPKQTASLTQKNLIPKSSHEIPIPFYRSNSCIILLSTFVITQTAYYAY